MLRIQSIKKKSMRENKKITFCHSDSESKKGKVHKSIAKVFTKYNQLRIHSFISNIKSLCTLLA